MRPEFLPDGGTAAACLVSRERERERKRILSVMHRKGLARLNFLVAKPPEVDELQFDLPRHTCTWLHKYLLHQYIYDMNQLYWDTFGHEDDVYDDVLFY